MPNSHKGIGNLLLTLSHKNLRNHIISTLEVWVPGLRFCYAAHGRLTWPYLLFIMMMTSTCLPMVLWRYQAHP